MPKPNPADSAYNQKSSTVRKPRQRPKLRQNPTPGGRIFGNWQGPSKARGKAGGK